MVIKVYISGISGNKEVKKRQQRVLMILDSKNIQYDAVDIAEPGNEEAKEFMQNNAKSLGATISDTNPKHALPPQVFNDEEYCGDYDMFDLANEVDEIEKFLKLAPSEIATSNAEIKLGNGEVPPEDTKEDAEQVNGKKEEAKPSEEPNEVKREENEVNEVKSEGIEEPKANEEEVTKGEENVENKENEEPKKADVEINENEKTVENGSTGAGTEAEQA